MYPACKCMPTEKCEEIKTEHWPESVNAAYVQCTILMVGAEKTTSLTLKTCHQMSWHLKVLHSAASLDCFYQRHAFVLPFSKPARPLWACDPRGPHQKLCLETKFMTIIQMCGYLSYGFYLQGTVCFATSLFAQILVSYQVEWQGERCPGKIYAVISCL